MVSQIISETPEGNLKTRSTEGTADPQNQPPRLQLEDIYGILIETRSERESHQARLAIARDGLTNSKAQTKDHEAQLTALEIKISETAIGQEHLQETKHFIRENGTSLLHIAELEAELSLLENADQPKRRGESPTASASQQEADDLYYQIHGVGGYKEQIEHLNSQLDGHDLSEKIGQLGEPKGNAEKNTAEPTLPAQLHANQHAFGISTLEPNIEGQPAQKKGEQGYSNPVLLQEYEEEIAQLRSSRGELLDQFLALQEEFVDLQKQFVDLQEQAKLETTTYSKSLQQCTYENNKLKHDIHYFATAITEMEAERNREGEKYNDVISERDSKIAALQSEPQSGQDPQPREVIQELLEKDTTIAILRSELKSHRNGQAEDEIQKRDKSTATLRPEVDSKRKSPIEQTQSQQYTEINTNTQPLEQHESTAGQPHKLSEPYRALLNEHKDTLEELEMSRGNNSELKKLKGQLQAQLREKVNEAISLQSERQAQLVDKSLVVSLQEELDKQREEFIGKLQSEKERGRTASREFQELKNFYQNAQKEQHEQVDQHEAVVRALRSEKDQHKGTALQRDRLADQYQTTVRELEDARLQSRGECSLCKEQTRIIEELQQSLLTYQTEHRDLQDQIMALGDKIERDTIRYSRAPGDTDIIAKNRHLENKTLPATDNQSGQNCPGDSQPKEHEISQQSRNSQELDVPTTTAPVNLNRNHTHLVSQFEFSTGFLQHQGAQALQHDKLVDISHQTVENRIDQSGQHRESESTGAEQNHSTKRTTRWGTRSTRNRDPIYTWPPSRVQGKRVSKKRTSKK